LSKLLLAGDSEVLDFLQLQRRTTLRDKICAAAIAVTTLLASSSLWAHHSTSAVFDMSKRVTLSGMLTKVDWINPHIVVFIDAKSGSGKVEEWIWESNPPSWFRRVGAARKDFAKGIGQTVKVEGIRAKDGSLYGYLQKITFADGSSMELANPPEAR
jgi:hypothetical protein